MGAGKQRPVRVLAAVFAGVWAATRPAASQGTKTITVEVVHKDESSKTFTYHTDAEYLGEVLQAEGLVKGDPGDYGLYITEPRGWVQANSGLDGRRAPSQCAGRLLVRHIQAGILAQASNASSSLPGRDLPVTSLENTSLTQQRHCAGITPASL